MARKAKPTRRKRGTGIIRHRPARALPFEAEFPIAGADSRYHSFAGRPDAEKWLDALVKERDEGGRDHIGGAQPFKMFIEKWLTMRAPKIGPKTLHNYRYYCELAIGQIGKLQLDTIGHDVIDEMVLYFYRKGFKNLKQLCSPLKQAFKYAFKRRYIKENPFDDLQIPETEHKEIVVLTQAQRAHMLEIARNEYDPDVPLHLLWHFYSRYGMRKGEGIGLKWADIDWEGRTISIRESVTNIGPDNVRGRTKGKKTRIAPLFDDIYQLLQAHHVAQLRRGVFPSIFVDTYGETVTPQHVQYRWSLLRKAADIPDVTLHGLRHTALFLMAIDNIPENIRMALAGHTTKEMAERYVNHATVADIRKAMG